MPRLFFSLPRCFSVVPLIHGQAEVLMKHSSVSLAPLFWMAVGTFAVGTESFMIAGVLPDIAVDLSVSISTAGQLVTVFALAYALSSPILTALTARVSRHTLLIGSMLLFTLANLAAWAATDYWVLMAARVLLAFTAGLYVPGANALAGALAGPERRGTALAIVNGGITIAVALGVPLGALVGDRLGWRMTFASVAALSALASVGLLLGLSRDIGKGLPVASLRERFNTARQPVILMTLLVTTLWAMGAYTLYTYLALFISESTLLNGAQIGFVLFSWGAAAAVGVVLGGKGVDRVGPHRLIVPCLIALIVAFAGLSTSAHLLSRPLALIPILIAVVVWGIAHWAFYPAQQANLISIAGLKGTPIALSLNASFMYLGFSLGAVSGSLVLHYATPADLGWAATACELLALGLTLSIRQRQAGAPCAALQCPAV
jgi:predicted MFS family arabinose efflux permease